MKLRNKENRLTGTLTYLGFNIDEDEKEIDLTILLDNTGGECIDKQLYSLDELKKFLDEWQEVEEPLIKDEKIRKAVRAWSDVNDFEPDYDVKYSLNCYSLISWQADIEFNTPIEGLEDGMKYTIEELCGEEKTCES